MATKKKLLQAAAGAAGGEALNVEDVFSTYLYEGNGSTQTITNGIDLDGEGGMVWIKQRTNAYGHYLYDTERGVQKGIASDSTAVEQTGRTGVTSFNSNGFSLGNFTYENGSGHDICSWTFRKAPKFFDVVTYTGTGSAQNISHNLGSVPAVMFVKSLDSGSRWNVYHKDASPTGNPENGRMALNTTDAWAEYPSVSVFAGLWNQTAPTDSVFTVGSYNDTNASGENFVAYLFAHNDGDGEFGPDGDADIIKCGSYSGDSTTDGSHEINLGFEPQWVLIKQSNGSDLWFILDTMRGMTDSSGSGLYPHSSAGEDTNASAFKIQPTPTGFRFFENSGFYNLSGEDYIYIAIRRGPMAVPTDATEVYNTILRTGTSSTASVTGVGFSPDLIITGARNANRTHGLFTRLHGAGKYQISTGETGEYSNTTTLTSFDMDGYSVGSDSGSTAINTLDNLVSWNFKRATNVYDTVIYNGTGSATTVSHNLGIAPELIMIKGRSTSFDRRWIVYTGTANKYMRLNTNDSQYTDGTVFNNTSPSATSFTVGTSVNTNANGETYIAHLFGTLSGVSKVGSYTGNGTSLNIDCGFSSGARFVLIKGSSFTHDWHVFDTERGIVAGNDPFLELNTTNAENSSYDALDPYSAGFTINQTSVANLNANGASYIFYAIA